MKKRSISYFLISFAFATLWVAINLNRGTEPTEQRADEAPAVTAIKIKPQADDGSLAEFQRYTDSLLREIPTPDDLKSELDAHISHSLPKSVRRFAPKIAHVQSVMRGDARNVEVGLNFYEKCALDNTALVTIRAVCLKMFRTWDRRTEIPVSDEIAQISTSLPGDDL